MIVLRELNRLMLLRSKVAAVEDLRLHTQKILLKINWIVVGSYVLKHVS